MKKILKTLFVLILTLTMSGCMSNVVASSDELKSGYSIEGEAARMATGLVYTAGQKDYDSFLKYTDGDDEKEIRELYDQLGPYAADLLPDFGDQRGVLIGQKDDCYLVNVTFYETNLFEEEHNAVLEPISMDFAFRKVDGELKLVTDANLIDELYHNLGPMFPKTYIEARSAERNRFMANPENLMYLDVMATYFGYVHSEVKFASQNADGSIDLLMWLANGTENEVNYKDASVTLVDDQLGTIVSTTVPINESVPDYQGTIVVYTIPANQVVTGMTKWNNVQANIECNYEEV